MSGSCDSNRDWRQVDRKTVGFFSAGCVVLLYLTTASPATAQPDPVVDGRFEEWQGVAPVYSDAQGDGIGDFDFGRIWVRNDDRYLFVSFELAGDILLQAATDLSIGLDTDNDPSTGEPFESIGAELIWNFGERIGAFRVGDQTLDVAFQDVGLASAPTVTSAVFEFSLELDAEPRRLGALFPADTVRLVLAHGASGDRIPDAGEEAVFTIDRNAATRTIDIDLGRNDPAAMRLLSWNVEQDGLFSTNKTSVFSRILQALDPDVIVFSEIFSHTAAQTLQRVTELAPLEAGSRWYASAGPSSVVVVSRTPVERTIAVEQSGRAHGFVVSRPDGFDSDMLIVGAHLFCCEADAGRQRQVDQIMATIRDSQDSGLIASMTPIVLAGDMNFVGDRRQPETLINGDIVNVSSQPSFDPDWDGTPLRDVVPMTTGLPQTFTWINPRAPSDGQFSPGRLDYIIYTDAVLGLGNAFALYTPAISFGQLQEEGLSASDTNSASDHLPVVADFIQLNTTASERRPELGRTGALDLYPNPVTDRLQVAITAGLGVDLTVEIFDVLGRKVLSATPTRFIEGRLVGGMDVSRLAPGYYVLSIRSKETAYQSGFIKTPFTN